MTNPQSSRINTNYLFLAFIIIAFILYGNTLKYGFVLDDDVYIKKHSTVQKGIGGIGEIFAEGSTLGYSNLQGKQPYRPITLTSFAITKTLFNNAPFIEHFINILLYGIIGCVLYNLLSIWLKNKHQYVKIICVLLFLVHPVHTEVVANIKSRDEIFTLLFGLTSLIFIHTFFAQKRKTYLALSLLFFTLSVFSKENGLLFFPIILLSLYFFEGEHFKRNLKSILPFALVVVIYLLIRNFVIDEVEDTKEDIINNVLVGAKTFEQKSATISSHMGKYLQLLFKPYPLSWDYSYNQLPVVSWNSAYAIISILIHSGLLVFASFQLSKKDLFSFLIIFYLISISIYTNIFFLNGATLAERFLFTPSVSFCIAIPLFFLKGLKIDLKNFSGKTIYVVYTLFGVVFLFGAVLTIVRNTDWKSDFTLFESGVKVAPNSSKAHAAFAYELNALADKTFESQKKNDLRRLAENEYLKSLEIYPKNSLALFNLGNFYYVQNKPKYAIEQYLKVLEITPNNLDALSNIGTMYFKEGMLHESKIFFLKLDQLQPSNKETLNYLGIIDFQLKNYSEARKYFEKLVELDANNANALGNIAATYQREKKYDQAILYYEKSLLIDPKDANFRNNLQAIKNYLNTSK